MTRKETAKARAKRLEHERVLGEALAEVRRHLHVANHFFRNRRLARRLGAR